jgi:hypothetical protein
VEAGRVRALVVALADMRLIEAKTDQVDRYPRLEVEDVDAEEAKSRQVRLESADGAVLAEAIIGKQRQRRTGTEASGTYLRRPGEAVSWLASGSVRIEGTAEAWLEEEIVDLDAEQVQRVEIRPLGGPSYAVVRDVPGAPLRFEAAAEDEALADGADLDAPAYALTVVRLEDVAPAADQPWPEARHVAVVTTFDGLELTVELAEIEAQPWARFAAREVKPLVATPADVSRAPGDAVVEELVPDAAALDERLGGWSFRVPQTLFERLTQPRDTFMTGDKGA